MKQQRSLTIAKNTFKWIIFFCRDHLLRTSSLLSNGISENLWIKGHLQSKQRNPHSNSVPSRKERIFSISLTINTARGWPLLTRRSATCPTPTIESSKSMRNCVIESTDVRLSSQICPFYLFFFFTSIEGKKGRFLTYLTSFSPKRTKF